MIKLINWLVEFATPIVAGLYATYTLYPDILQFVSSGYDISNLYNNNFISHYILLLISVIWFLFHVDLMLFRYETLPYLFPNHQKRSLARVVRILFFYFSTMLASLSLLISALGILKILLNVQSRSVLKPELQVVLILLSVFSIYAYRNPEKRKEILLKHATEHGTVAIIDRNEEHNQRKKYLDEAEQTDRLLLVTLQEPREGMKEEGYYIEKDFMKHWWRAIEKNHVNVEQVILINSKKDVDDFISIVRIIANIPSYKLGYIVAHPSIFYADMFFVPDKVVLLSLSSDMTSRSMANFALKITGNTTISNFCRMYDQVYTTEATFVKTFEGVDETKITELRAIANKISQHKNKIPSDIKKYISLDF